MEFLVDAQRVHQEDTHDPGCRTAQGAHQQHSRGRLRVRLRRRQLLQPHLQGLLRHDGHTVPQEEIKLALLYMIKDSIT